MSDPKSPIRVSQSFTPEEIDWLDQLLGKLRTGSTVDRVMLRAAAGAGVMKKARAMHDRLTFLRNGGGEKSD